MSLYCDIPQVNQLTALLIAHGVRHCVVCPGSRNATIVHNLFTAQPSFTLHPVTDERSAAFVALGLCLSLGEPVMVCVTSGSALLNTIPAVAEAYYRHLPLLVVSADRPNSRIGQLDGQTLPQNGALRPYCSGYPIAFPHTEELRLHNNLQINKALLALRNDGGRPSHINVAIDEPMFSFTTDTLPQERKVQRISPIIRRPLPPDLVETIAQAQLPALLVGQYEKGDLAETAEKIAENGQMLVLPEILSGMKGSKRMNSFDALSMTDQPIVPDLNVQIGGNYVHKNFRQMLRSHDCNVIRIDESADIPDTFSHLTTILQASPREALLQLEQELPHGNVNVKTIRKLLDDKWRETEQQLSDTCEKNEETLTFHKVLLSLHDALNHSHHPFTLHLANSTAVRAAANVFEGGSFPIYCNRGVNGIEGSLSAAVGYALNDKRLAILIIGDLSFYYDVNALNNTALPCNLRILLLNNAHGGIFDHLNGLSQSPARDRYVAAKSSIRPARGIAETFNLEYAECTAPSALKESMARWLTEDGKAKILEIPLP